MYSPHSPQLLADARHSGGSGLNIAPEVSRLVDYIWEEVSGRLDEVLATPLEAIKMEQVEKAEAALLSIKNLLEAGKNDRDGENYIRMVCIDTYEAVHSLFYQWCS